MHGRLKIKTTAQQEAEKKKERAAKLAGYRKAMGAILSRRKEGARDEKQLKLSAGVLMANPDIHTLWNIRRECVESIICEHEKRMETDKSQGEQAESEGDPPKSDESNTEETGGKEPEEVARVSDSIWLKEVELTGQCLLTNPKSYGAWHHRCFSLDKMSSPPWTNELALCDKFLSMDERNFHCWDYRQIAAKRAQRKPEAELDFTMDRINNNFSNYSAWHYRSKLLPKVHPSHDGLPEAVHHAELELVQNAAFTDPDDSSAWFYHTWLLGNQGEHKGPRLLYLKSDLGTLTVATSKEVSSDEMRVRIGDSETVTWRPGPRFRSEWVCDDAGAGQAAVVSLGQETLELVTSGERRVVTGSGLRDLKFTPAPSEATRTVFLEELDNCNQLIELEPDSKWPLYTRAMIMRSLDSEEYSQDILDTLIRLVEVDPMRRGYYTDLRDKIIIEKLLEKAAASRDFESIDLSPHKLSKIFYRQYLNIFKEIKW